MSSSDFPQLPGSQCSIWDNFWTAKELQEMVFNHKHAQLLYTFIDDRAILFWFTGYHECWSLPWSSHVIWIQTEHTNAPSVFAACWVVGLSGVSCILKKTCKLQLKPSNSILMLSAFSNHRRQDSFALMIFTCSCTTFLPAGVKWLIQTS